MQVRRNDEVEAQRRRWTFYETIKLIMLFCSRSDQMKTRDGRGERQIPDLQILRFNAPLPTPFSKRRLEAHRPSHFSLENLARRRGLGHRFSASHIFQFQP